LREQERFTAHWKMQSLRLKFCASFTSISAMNFRNQLRHHTSKLAREDHQSAGKSQHQAQSEEFLDH